MRFPGKSAPAATASAGPSKHENGSKFSFGVLATMLVCAAAFLGIGAPAASAAPAGESYAYKADIGSGETGTSEPSFGSVATAAGRVFIGRQYDFNAEGGFQVLEADGTPITQYQDSNRTNAIAVTPDGSAVYVLTTSSGSATETAAKYTSDGAPTPTYTQDPTWAPSVPGIATGIAVDPVTGDVLIVAGGPVYRFDSATGMLLSTIDGSTTDAGTLNAKYVAVAPNRDIYTLSSTGRADRFGADGSWKGKLNIPLSSKGDFSGLGIAVNPTNSDVAVDLAPGFVSYNDRVIRIFTAAGDFKEDVRVPPAVADGNLGLAFSTDGTKLYIGLNNGTAHLFELGTKPGLDGPTVSQLTPFGFHLTDTVATGGETTEARLEYCLATDPCERYLTSEAPSPWHTLPTHTVPSDPGDDEVTIEDDLSGLSPLTDYLVRSYAINQSSGVENISSPVEVTTPLSPPAVETGAALADLTTATLNGTINAWGGQTTFHFEYGLTTNYDSRVPAIVDAPAGKMQTPRSFSRAISGLQPGTTYHYRLVATNGAGTVAGDDRIFTTLGVDQVAPQRGYEQVTSPNKNGLVLNGRFGFQAAPGGGAIEYGATAPPVEADSAPVVSRFIARRGDSNWAGQQPVDPPQNATEVILASVTGAVSDDFEHTLSVSSVALTPDAVEGAANIYVKDLRTGVYDLVGSTAVDPTALTFGFAGTKQQNWYMAGAPDFSWVMLISRFPLLDGAPQAAMYKWSKADGLSIVSLLPGDSVPTGDTWSQSSEFRTSRLVSDDGSTVAFSLTSGETGVYLRSGAETVAISESQASGGPTGPQPGVALGMSRDGRYVFLVSPNQLTDDASDMTGSSSRNLYRYDASSGLLEFLGVEGGSGGDGAVDLLAISDDGDTVYWNGSEESNGGLSVWRNGQLDTVSSAPNRSSYVFASPNGRYLSFLEEGAVYLYDADAGEKSCISCPVNDVAKGGDLPEGERNISNRRPQVVTDDGHAYFMTTQPLLSADRNGVTDVYEYYEGRLTLISPGNDNYAAFLVDISPDGRDVYFTTAQGLVSQDTDGGYDLYDARIGGGLAAQNPPPPPPPCQGDFCQGTPPLSPSALPLGSAQPKGSGKTKAKKVHCAKNKRKVRRNGKVRCVKKRNAKHNRGASR